MMANDGHIKYLANIFIGHLLRYANIMTNLPPSRTAEKIMVRLPDGMREKLQAMASANHRSVNAEVVAILASALDNPGESDLEGLVHEGIRLNAELRHAAEHSAMIQERLSAVERALRAYVGDVKDPFDSGMRRVMVQRVCAREAKGDTSE